MYKGDVRDRALLNRIFFEQTVDAVIHFAGAKAVGESVEKPLAYYDNNIGSTLTLYEAMRAYGIKELTFSSSATVYSPSEKPPWREDTPSGTGLTHPVFNEHSPRPWLDAPRPGCSHTVRVAS